MDTEISAAFRTDIKVRADIIRIDRFSALITFFSTDRQELPVRLPALLSQIPFFRAVSHIDLCICFLKHIP